MKKVSLIIPCYNEEESIPMLYDKICAVINDNSLNYEWELLFIDDGSADCTIDIIKTLRVNDKRVNVVQLSRNFGKERAMLAGFDFVTGDCAIILDADLQHPPEIIPQMLELWEQGYEDVYARRQDRGKESWLRKRLSLLYYKMLNRSTRFEVLQNVGDFRLIDRCCINALRSIRESERYTKGMFCWIGFKKKEIKFNQGDRLVGNSKWKFSSLFNLAIEGFTSFSTLPLRIASVLGLIIAFCSILYMLYFFVKTIFWGDSTTGFPTLIIVILFLGSVQLITIGIIGEYLGRIFNETKNRPTYIAREYNGKKLNTTINNTLINNRED